jgi:pYEATS domain-containing protein involved in immunity/TIR domain-containing protein
MRLEQKATYAADNWWEWSVWIEGDKEELKQIEYVEYILHPSFPEPVQRIEDRSSKFRLDSSGWGEFTIRATVVTKQGDKKTLRHRLELRYPKEEGNAAEDQAVNTAVATEPSVFFLSCNIADSLFANALSKALLAKGARVLMVADEPSGLPWDASINRLLDQADFAVFIISGPLGSWMTREMEASTERKIPIIPIIIVSSRVNTSELPTKARKPIPIKPVSPEKFDDEAQHVAQRIYKEIAALGASKKKAAKPQ